MFNKPFLHSEVASASVDTDHFTPKQIFMLYAKLMPQMRLYSYISTPRLFNLGFIFWAYNDFKNILFIYFKWGVNY